MSFSYTGDPTSSDLDALRFVLGDTIEASALFSDEELTWVLTQSTNPWLAAALAADTASSKYASVITSANSGTVKTKTVGALSISYETAKERMESYTALARRFRMNAAVSMSLVGIYSGGISISDKIANEQDTDWDKPAFTRGMHDYSGTDLPPSQFLSTST